METNGIGPFGAFIRHVEEFETVPPGGIVFREGDSGESLFVVRSGAVELAVGDIVVETVGPGGVFGEMALTGSHQRSARATAVEETTLVRVDQAQFDRVVQLNPFIAREFMRLIATRLSAMNTRLKSLS